MPLSWHEIKSRALTFSRAWADAANEDSQGKPKRRTTLLTP